ncbi:MAG: 3-isopropylmalate dehydratase [Myxococcales bacterium]|nr:3-isopropylmalate dehydratase [Myxococcales bacterium]
MLPAAAPAVPVRPPSRASSPAAAPAAAVQFEGRILFLYDDPDLIRRQLAGEDLAWDPALPLVDNISTDEITPGWVCFHFDATLGDYSLVGLRGGAILAGDLKRGGFAVIVSGKSKGCGSSRETAPFSEQAAGIQLVLARNIEKIYGQNCQNIGLLTSTDFGLIDRIRRGEAIALEEFTAALDPVAADIVRKGGLFAYNRARLAGDVQPPLLTTPPRPMTLVEKIVARNVIADARSGRLGAVAVQPGDAVFVRTDVRFSHDYTTAMAQAAFHGALGATARVNDVASVFAFRDHLTFLSLVMPEKHRQMGLDGKAALLADIQREFCRVQGIRLYDETADGRGSEAICHNAVLEDLAVPGDIVVGTDSHTCTAGALGTFAFGVGSTDMANTWYTKDIRVQVPESVRFVVTGKRRAGIAAKDIMLRIMATPFIKDGKAIGKVLEFTGPGVGALSMDERATLTNMAVEAGATTGIIEADEVVLKWLAQMRPGLDVDALRPRMLRSDSDARYLATFEIDLDDLALMVATPGDPRNGIPLADLPGPVKIDIAYGGSCTGGKMADMDMYASVLRAAVDQGRRVAPGVELYIQFGSQKIKQYAVERGYLALFAAAGAKVIDPSCGACINAGPGVSKTADTVTISAINRNFPGRSGPGKVYLASPLVVAASAVAGYIVGPDEIVGAHANAGPDDV